MILARLQLLVVVVVLSAARAYIDLVSVEQEYIAYLRTFGKSLDRLTDSRRVERFKHQIQIIHEHNARETAKGKAGTAFSLQLNAMSDMLPEEVNQLFGYRNNKKNVTREHSQTSKKGLRKKKQDSEDDESYYHSNLYPFFGKKKLGKAKEALWKNVVVPETINWSNNDNPIGSSVMSSVRNQVCLKSCYIISCLFLDGVGYLVSCFEKRKSCLCNYLFLSHNLILFVLNIGHLRSMLGICSRSHCRSFTPDQPEWFGYYYTRDANYARSH